MQRTDHTARHILPASKTMVYSFICCNAQLCGHLLSYAHIAMQHPLEKIQSSAQDYIFGSKCNVSFSIWDLRKKESCLTVEGLPLGNVKGLKG